MFAEETLMAHIVIQDENRRLSSPAEINAFLAPFGIHYERWDVAGRLKPDATAEEVLATYAPEIERLKAQGGYVTADVIKVTPDVPGLDAMLARFSKEHTHSEDEVRFIVEGRGVFHIHPDNGPIFGIQLDAGDLINVPLGTKHWFDLCEEKRIRAIRLFQDKSGWTPHYIDGNLHERYQPLCLGPSDVPAELASGVRL